MKRTKIKTLLAKNEQEALKEEVLVCGWIKTARHQKTFSFIEINDGSCFSNLQVIADQSLTDYQKMIEQFTTGASLEVKGKVVKSPGNKQRYEIHATAITVLGLCPNDYILQKKRHSFEFLRTIAHLRPRTNTQGAVLRVRNALAYATHKFFQERDFLYIHTPIITGSDCEGAGELFQVTTFNMENPPKNPDHTIDYKEDFFAKQAYLTVSGQLNGEAMASALSDIYTFGPTFRAENSNTSRHLAEFWMIEPELAFANLKTVQDLAEEYLKFLIQDLLKHCQEDLEFFNRFIDSSLLERLHQVYEKPFVRLPYTEAINILKEAKKDFEYPIEWGSDLQSEHERYIAEEHYKSPVILYDYPKNIKAFYMRDNEDGKTVAAMDVLIPKIGEIIGGSQREDRYDVLYKKMVSNGLNPQEYEWYLDLRKYGSVPHGGFGLGFERLVQFASGMDNIRDVIPFPRTPGHAEY